MSTEGGIEVQKGSAVKRVSTGISILFLSVILLFLVIVSAGMGYVKISFPDVFRIILSAIFGETGGAGDLYGIPAAVVMDVRLPRILAAAAVGAGLAVSGAVFQGILQNPLADPYTLGVSAGAAFGASLAILLNIGFMGHFSITAFAFAGAVITLFLVIYLSCSSVSAATGGGLSSNNLILSGIIHSVCLKLLKCRCA